MKIRKYYLLYKDKVNIDYIYLLKIYKKAQCIDDDYIKNTIQFSSKKELAEKVDIKYNALLNILKNQEYKDYFTVSNNQLVINNNFKADNKERVNKFVVLTEKEADILIQYNNNLLAKYFIYHKYYCGFSKYKCHNSTAKQILDTMGYSNKSNNYISQLSRFNKILVDENMIQIQNYIENGKHRIFYYFA